MQLDVESARFNLIEQQIRPWNVHDLELLQALKNSPREEFVLPSQKSLAFSDTELALPFENRYLLAPKVEARILQAVRADLQGDVLIIGSDLGYLASIFIAFGQNVSILDENQQLLDMAQANLQKFQHRATLIHQPFTQDINQQFSTIIITASLDKIYQPWLDGINDNGQMTAFIGNAPILKALKYSKKEGKISITPLFETWVNRLPNMPVQSSFYF